jgi:rhodanese-related sulfurtransferase
MKSLKLLLSLIILFIGKNLWAQNPENWTSKDLLQPAALAQTLQEGKNIPLIFSVGPSAIIPHSVEIGMVKDKENLDKLKKQLKGLPKNKSIVVYCGCCPYDHCPDVRPAVAMLKEMGFTNYKLLDLPHNIKADWLNKGYPANK